MEQMQRVKAELEDSLHRAVTFLEHKRRVIKMESKQKLGRLITVVATFLAFSGIGVVDPILPIIAEKIGASHWQVEMLFTAYILTMAIMMLPAGIFASRFGDKRMMTIGLAIVTVFAFICGMSQTIAQLSLSALDGD